MRPFVADTALRYVRHRVPKHYDFPHNYFLNKVIADTRCRHDRFTFSAGQKDPAKEAMYDWRKSDPAKRRAPIVPQATIYWFFRYSPESSYFVDLAKKIWKNDSELLSRFCFAKETGNANDPFEAILGRFRSEEARTFKALAGNDQLSATYPALFDFGASYQSGRPEFLLARELLLSTPPESISPSTAIYGAGGYGKSSLAHELCDDDDVRAKFPGGIYWLQFGLVDSANRTSGFRLSEAIDRMIVAQYHAESRPKFVWNHDDSDIAKLLAVLPKPPFLLVADDIGSERQSSWLAKVPKDVPILITTRRQSVAKQAVREIPIKRLTDEAAYNLLTHGMENLSNNQQNALLDLAKRFKGWPLLLNLANGRFKRISGNARARVEKVIREYEEFLEDDQIDGWDTEEADDDQLDRRRKLVGYCIEAGIKAIHPSNHPSLLRVLAVFPDNVDIPFSVVFGLWNKHGVDRIGRTKGITRLTHFNDFSFFSAFDNEAQVLRLHDEILAYFRSGLTREQGQSLHRQLIASLRDACPGDWNTLPHNELYGWTRLLDHMRQAGLNDEADDLRTDFRWLKAKLAAVGASELLRSFSHMSDRKDACDVRRAINLSMPVIAERPKALAHQLYGRLGHETDIRLANLVRAAQNDRDFWPIPNRPHLASLGRELLRLTGHHSGVNSAAFDPSGRKIVTASWDKTARIWDAGTGEQIGRALEGHLKEVVSAAFDPSGRKIVTASRDKTARIWDAETGEQIGRMLEGHLDVVVSVAFDPSGRKIVTASHDRTARIWDAETGEPIGTSLVGHRNYLTSAAVDPSGSMIATASGDFTARLWDAETGRPIGKPLEGHTSRVSNAIFDSSGSKIVTASWDKTVRFWDAKTGKPIGLPHLEHRSPVNSVAIDSNGRMIVTALWDCTAWIWDAEAATPIDRPLEGHQGQVNTVIFAPAGRKILTASWDGTARLWDFDAPAPSGDSDAPDNLTASVTLSSSGERIVAATIKGTARLWDSQKGGPIGKPFGGGRQFILNAAFDPSCHRIVTPIVGNAVLLWDAESGALVGQPLEGHQGLVEVAKFDPSGSRILTASWDRTARLWDAVTGEQIGKFEGHLDKVSNAAFDPSGAKIVTASWDRTARIWDVETGQQIGELEDHEFRVTSATFDPSGRKVLTTSHDIAPRLWDSETGERIGKFEGHQNIVHSAAFDSNGGKIVTASADGTARIWDAETGTQIGRLDGHRGSVTGAAFGLSDGIVATISDDCTARIWSAEKLKCEIILDFDEALGSIVPLEKYLFILSKRFRLFVFQYRK